MRNWLLGLVVMLVASPSIAARCDIEAQDLLARPAPDSGPTEVTVQVYVNDIVSIRDADQSFTSDVFFRVEWLDARLAHDGRSPCTAGMNEIWTPELLMANRRSMQLVSEPKPVVDPRGIVRLMIRGFGDFSFHADLSDFPFDQQQLYFDLMSRYDIEEVNFVIELERIALAPRLSVANFTVTLDEVEKRESHIAATQLDHAQLLIKMRAQRLTGYYTWQQLVPLLLVVLMSWIVFWIPREHVPSRIGLAATSMLTLIAYRFAMSSVLPPIAYLTRLDIFMIGASVLVFSALATAVAVTYLADLVDERLADRLNVLARILVPLVLTVIGVAAFNS